MKILKIYFEKFKRGKCEFAPIIKNSTTSQEKLSNLNVEWTIEYILVC